MVIAGENIGSFMMSQAGLEVFDELLKLLSSERMPQFKNRIVDEVVYNFLVWGSLPPKLPVLIVSAMIMFFCHVVQEQIAKVYVVPFFQI